jgi:hypothetical protein
MELTKDQQLALAEVRKAMCDRLKLFCFTDEMLKDKSILQLLTLLQLMIGHRNYLGMYTQTWIVLEEIFGTDAFWDKPAVPKSEPELAQESKPVVN